MFVSIFFNKSYIQINFYSLISLIELNVKFAGEFSLGLSKAF